MHRSYACSSAARLSAHRCLVVGLPLICHACIARLSTRLSAGLPLSCRWYIAALSARVVVADLSAALPLVLPLLCLFVSLCSVTYPSLVCLFVSLCSVTYPSLSRLLVSWSLTCLLVSYLSLVCRWSAARLLYCSTRLLCRWSAARLFYCSTRLLCRWSVARLLYCSARLLYCSARLLYCSTWLLYCSARLLYCSTWLLHSAAPLGCSTRLLHSTALLLGCSTRLLDSTRLALRAFLFYLLCLAATLFTHTLSHAWCPVTLLSLTRCSTVVVTVAAASCGRARDSIGSMGSMGSIGAVARCVVAARLPPSVISVTVQQCSAVHRRIQKMVSVS